MGRPRWRRWGTLGGVAVGMWLVSAAARPETPPTPPLIVEVAYGDSLWTLARSHGDPERDVRDVVTVIMHTNQIGAGRLRPGQRLLIPAEYAAEASGMR
jgi:hypothetical protein